jgi:hypothetical protein
LFNAQKANFAKNLFWPYFGTSAPGADEATGADAGAEAATEAEAGAVAAPPKTPAEACGL